MTEPIICFRCSQEIARGHAMHFEGDRAVHKGCYGKVFEPKLPALQDFELPLWIMTREEFKMRAWTALTLLLLLALVML